MGDKNIKMQDTQKESQEKETEINDLKDKVFNNEQKINQMQLRLNELCHAIEQEENRVVMKRNYLSHEDFNDDEQKKIEDQKQKELDLVEERERAHYFLKNMIDDLEVLCWINQRDGKGAEERAYELEKQEKEMRNANDVETKKRIKDHDDNVAI